MTPRFFSSSSFYGLNWFLERNHADNQSRNPPSDALTDEGNKGSARSRRTGEVCRFWCDPAASSTPGNSLFTKAEPLRAFGVVTPRFDIFIVQRGLLLPSGFVSHHRETSKGDGAFC